MKGLPLRCLVDARVDVTCIFPNIPHVPEDMTLCIL